MRSVTFYIVASLAFFALLKLVNPSPSENFSNTDIYDHESPTSGLLRQKRQSKEYNPSVTTAFLVAIALLMCTPPEQEKKLCPINVKNLDYSHALIIDPADHTKFLYPNDDGIITFQEHDPVFLSCPGPNNHLKSVAGSRQSHTFKCVCGQAFDADNTVHDFKDLVCESPPQYEILPLGYYGREREFSKFSIGFYTDEQRNYLTLIHIRYDRSLTSTMWVKSEISKAIAGGQKTAKNRRFDQTHCCEALTLDLDEAYKTTTQDQSFAQQLACHTSEEQKCSYLDEKKGIVFNRGHLVPKSTFVYTSAGVATFVYLNTGIQWKPINDGNWARIEEHVVEMAKILKKDLTVYTGVLDRLMLKDTADENNMKYIFLYKQNDVTEMAVPLYFWKLVYEPESKKGIVFVTVNNPFIDDYAPYNICNNVMIKIDGAKMPKQWRPKYIPKGYSYMCQVADFTQYNGLSLDNFPGHTVTDLLYLPQAGATVPDDKKEQPGANPNKHDELKRFV